MTPDQLSKEMKQKAQNLKRELDKAQRTVGKHAVKIARRQSSGRLSTAQLAAMDHPYATRHGVRTMAGLINYQTGTFFNAWRYDHGRKLLVNPVDYGFFLQHGSSRMNRRRLLEEIKGQLKPVMKKEVKRALRRAMK